MKRKFSYLLRPQAIGWLISLAILAFLVTLSILDEIDAYNFFSRIEYLAEYITNQIFKFLFNLEDVTVFFIMSASVIYILTSSIFLEKVRPRNYRRKNVHEERVRILKKKVDLLTSKIAVQNIAKDADIEEIKKDISKNILNDIGEEIQSRFRNEYGKEALEEKSFNLIDDTFTSLGNDLSAERVVASNRGYLSLAIGIFIAAIGIFVLYELVSNLSEKIDTSNWMTPILQISTRLSVVIFIGVFSFFFLNIYRANQQELKYYRNEITNVRLRQAATRIAWYKLSEADLSSISMELAATERNFILKKGESTVPLEQTRIDRHYDNQVTDQITGRATQAVKMALNSRKGGGKAETLKVETD